MKKINSLSGSWATLLLTTDKEGNIDYRRLEDEIDILISSNPDGIYSNGTACEFYSQSEEEFLRISECLALKCEGANIPFQIGVSHMSPQISLERLRLVKQLLPGAVQVILPDWFPVTMDEAVIFMQRMEEEADGIPLVLYNPPHAKKILTPTEWMKIKERIPSLIGVKVFDRNGDPAWYKDVKEQVHHISVFIPGHRLATGITQGAHGAYSNMACLNPFAAQKWYEQIKVDKEAGLELEQRIRQFMEKVINPFITRDLFSNHACDRFMALVGSWADTGGKLRWPYRSIPEECVEQARCEGRKIIPEFFTD
jgi:dihydrodipicolinate synthase/N-acetylneuraminate lyase